MSTQRAADAMRSRWIRIDPKRGHVKRRKRSHSAANAELEPTEISARGRVRKSIQVYDPQTGSSMKPQVIDQFGHPAASIDLGARTKRFRGHNDPRELKDSWAQCEECKVWQILPSHVSLSSLPERFVCADSHWLLAAARCCDHLKAEGSQTDASEEEQLPAVYEPAVAPVYEPAVPPARTHPDDKAHLASTQATAASTIPAQDAKRISALEALLAVLDSSTSTDTVSSTCISEVAQPPDHIKV